MIGVCAVKSPFFFRVSRDVLLIGAVVMAFFGLLLWSELDSWRSEVRQIQDDALSSAMSLAQHADDTVALATAPVVALVATLEFHDLTSEGVEEARDLVRQVERETPRIQDLLVFDENGRLLASSTPQLIQRGSATDQAFFIAHQSSPDRAPLLGDPFINIATNEWAIPVSMRVDHADGSFAGVVLATVDTRYFSNFYRSLQSGEHSATALIRDDGLLLARSPSDHETVGRNMSGTPLFTEHLRSTDSGTYEYTSPIDDVQRIGGYYRNPGSGLVVLCAVSFQEAMARWISEAQYRWASIAVLLIVGIALAIRLGQQNRRQKESDQILARREWEFRVLAEGTHDMVGRADVNGIFQYVSPASTKVLGVEPENLVGRNPLDFVLEEDIPDVMAAIERLEESDSILFEYRRIDAGPMPVWLETAVSRLPQSNTAEFNGFVSVTRDITQRKTLEAVLAEMAVTDWLTGLPNRRAFDQRLNQEILRSRRTGEAISLIMVDIDRFKLFNDTYGHDGGDACLRRVAQALKSAARRPADFVARYGGEEFAVVLPDTDANGAADVAEQMRRAAAALGIVHSENLPWRHVTISLGISTSASGRASADEMIHGADSQLYAAKRSGRNRAALALRDAAA